MGFNPDSNNSTSNNAIQLLFGLGKTAVDTNSQTQNFSTMANTEGSNAALEEIGASEATQKGILEGQKYGREFQQAFGSTQSSIVGSGTDATSGSALNRLNDLRKGGALDELTIRNQAANEAFGFTQRANADLTQQQLDEQKSKAALGAGVLTGGLQFLNFAQQNIKGSGSSPGPGSTAYAAAGK
jgi:hypothetical protein